MLVLVLAKCGKISNAQVVGLVVTTVLKKLSQLSGKVVTTIMKKLSQLSGKVVTTSMKQLMTAVCFGQKPMRSDGWFQTAGENIQHLLDGFGWKW